MSHTNGTAIPVVDMLLIKPSSWARANASTPRPLDDPGHDTPEGSGDSRVTTRTG